VSKNHTSLTPRAQRGPGFLDATRAVPNADGSRKILRFGGGLDLWVGATSKTWRCKVMRNGKQAMLTLGRFPEMSIKEAQAKRTAIKVAADPAQAKRTERVEAVEAAETTFRLVAEEWVDAVAVKARWTPANRRLVEQRLALHVFPVWGDRPIAEITAPEVRKLVGGLYLGNSKDRPKPAVAVVVKQYVSRVFDFAWSEDRVLFNPAKKIEVYLPSRQAGDEKPQPHVRTIEEARAVLAAVEARRKKRASPWTLLAHRLIALTGTRKTETLAAKWDEFDLDAAMWTIPAERMKGRHGKRTAHFVALAPQAIEVIRAARRIKTNDFVFASSGKNGNRGEGRISRCALNGFMPRVLRLAGLDPKSMVPHGWRHTFSTIMNEADRGDFRVVDVMLAHKGFRDSAETRVAKSSVEAHYNHAEYRSARHRIACQWADMLLEGAPTALALIGLEDEATNVVPLRRPA
jgi:integrase